MKTMKSRALLFVVPFAASVFLIGNTVAAEDLKLLMGFEKDEMAKWKGKRKPKTAEGDATQGVCVLTRKFPQKYVNWYLRSGKSMEEILYMQGTVLNTFGQFRNIFGEDWSGHDRLRMDVKSVGGPAKIRVMLEDELISPHVTRDYGIPQAEWVTVEFNLAEASKSREIKLSKEQAKRLKADMLKVQALNLSKMANIFVRMQQTDKETTILIDNIRLLKLGAKGKTKLTVLKDESPFAIPKELPFLEKPKQPEPYKGKRNQVKIRAAPPVRIDMKKRDSYGLFTMKRALAVVDNDRMLFGHSIGRVQVAQTLDGGKTWTDIKGKAGASTYCQHSANAPGNGSASAGDDLLVFYTARCANMARPSDFYFRLVKFDDKGWKLGPPRLVSVDVRHCPEHQVDCIRLKNGRIWIAWHHIDRFAKHWLCACYSDDGGQIWRSPSSNALVMVSRRKDPKPLALGTSFWQEDPKGWKAPEGGCSGRLPGRFHPHARFSLVPYGDSVACIFGDTRNNTAWTYFDPKTKVWTKPKIICRSFGGPVSVVTVGEKTIYTSFRREKTIYRLDGDKWIEDTPAGHAHGTLSLSGKNLFCFWFEKDGQETKFQMSRKPIDGKWSKPVTLSKETEKLQGINAPMYAPENFVPVIWGPKTGWIKIMRIPAEE